MKNAPLVSVVTLTYNQEKYIEQTLLSILDQETSFPFEIVLSDDGSTDSTAQIIEEVISNHPAGHKVKFLKHHNMGVLSNYIYTFPQCSGRYFAFCEGDDYWTDNKKLQIQADFLEANPDYSICFHQVRKISEQSFIANAPLQNVDHTYTIEDFAAGPVMYTPSVMIRFKDIELPVWYRDSPLFDYPLWMLAAKNGKIKYIAKNLADYRVGTGLWTSGHGHSNMKKLETLLTFLTREFDPSSTVYKELERRRKEVNSVVKSHEFYLDLYRGKADLSKISVKTALKLLISKIRSIL